MENNYVEYLFVGGPRNGEIGKFSKEGSEWFGFKWENGEYNTRLFETYKEEPWRLFWRQVD